MSDEGDAIHKLAELSKKIAAKAPDRVPPMKHSPPPQDGSSGAMSDADHGEAPIETRYVVHRAGEDNLTPDASPEELIKIARRLAGQSEQP